MYLIFYLSVKIRFVCAGLSNDMWSVGSRSIFPFDVILNLWINWAENEKYSIWARRFPTQFRSPSENGQTFGFFFAKFISESSPIVISYMVESRTEYSKLKPKIIDKLFLKLTIDKKSFWLENFGLRKIDWIMHNW